MNINANIGRLAVLFIVFFLALSGGLVYWQVVVGQQVAANIHNGRHYLSDNAPMRGRILDRNGVVLAESKPDPKSGNFIRHYTDPSLAGLIGYYVSPVYQSTGIELAYNDYLTGQRGATALTNTLNQALHRPPVGDDVYLTIDERIQQSVNTHFDDPQEYNPYTRFPTDRGSVIVTNPHTGEILAMLSSPSYDPNKLVSTLVAGDLSYYNGLNTNPEQPLLERPLQLRYAPGSTYKTLTLIAGLDSGHTTLGESFDMQHALGPIQYNGQKIGPVGNNIQNYTRSYPVNTEYAFTHSDNIIFAQIGVNTTASTWLDYNKRFYVGQNIPFDLPVVQSNVLQNGQPLADNELAANAFGQGYDDMTPLQMSLIDNAIANDGQLMRPRVVLKIADQTFDPQTLGSQQMSSQTATLVRQGMLDVIHCGSGTASPTMTRSPWGIIGKTGTAETGRFLPHGWMITQAPYSISNPSQLPALTIVAMKENSGEGGGVVGPLIANIYTDIFNNIMKVSPPNGPDPNYCSATGLVQG